jgi:hypothetical protein
MFLKNRVTAECKLILGPTAWTLLVNVIIYIYVELLWRFRKRSLLKYVCEVASRDTIHYISLCNLVYLQNKSAKEVSNLHKHAPLGHSSCEIHSRSNWMQRNYVIVDSKPQFAVTYSSRFKMIIYLNKCYTFILNKCIGRIYNSLRLYIMSKASNTFISNQLRCPFLACFFLTDKWDNFHTACREDSLQVCADRP